MEQTKTYVLTGAPGSGKTSILNYLEFFHGEFTIREAAEDYIRLEQALGISEPWNKPDFQNEILNLQLQRKKMIPTGISRVFVDRDIADGLAYVGPGDLYDRIYGHAIQQQLEKIFLIEQFETTQTNDVRREDYEQAILLGNIIAGVYTSLGYNVISVPPVSLEDRAQIILAEV